MRCHKSWHRKTNNETRQNDLLFRFRPTKQLLQLATIHESYAICSKKRQHLQNERKTKTQRITIVIDVRKRKINYQMFRFYGVDGINLFGRAAESRRKRREASRFPFPLFLLH